MRLKKGIFFLVLSVAAFVHAGGIYFCHHLPVQQTRFATRPMTTFLSTLESREKRTALLAEIFDNSSESQEKAKKFLYNLEPESPSFPPLLPSPISLSDMHSESLPTPPPLVLPTLPMDEEAKITISEGDICAPLPFEHKVTLSAPPLADWLRSSETLDSLGALASADLFSVSVEYSPRHFRPGYVFKIFLQPKPGVTFKRIRQNYFFLIDRSNSIPRARYFLNKQAVSESLEALKPGDTFNILIFDNHVVRFSNQTVPWSVESIAQARAFLDSQPHGGHFAVTELYASLGKIIPQNVVDEEVNTAILLSDGDTYLSLEKQRQTIGGWTATNGGKVSLFCVASGTGNNLSLLELISSFNKGSLLYIAQHDQISIRLKQLIESLQHPVGKNLTATAIASDKQTTISLQPKNIRLPHLYQNRLFVIWGLINRPEDFTLFLQGNYYDTIFDIKKKITFKESSGGTLSLEKQWAGLAAQEFYERFFIDGKLTHLDSARQFLAPLNLPVPFMTQN